MVFFVVRGGLESRPRLPSDRGGATTEREPWRSISQEDDDGGGWRISGQRSWRKGSAGTYQCSAANFGILGFCP